MSVFPPLNETWMVNLECLSHLPGPRFLDGRVADGSVGLAPNTNSPFTGTWWAVVRLAPNVVKFRCMTHVQGSGRRFLDGRTSNGTVGMQPMLASSPSGEWWQFEEQGNGSVTLECLNNNQNPNHRFLDGRTLDSSAGLAPLTTGIFTGTHWRVVRQGRIVALWCEGKGFGNRFLDGRLLDGTVGLAPMALGRFTGTRWLLQENGNSVTLKCLGELESDYRFLDGVLLENRVGLAPRTTDVFTGTHWEMMTEIPHPHSDVEPGFFATFKRPGAVAIENRFLDGILQSGSVGLAPRTDGPFTGTKWRVLPAGPFFEPCPRFREEPAPDRTVEVVRTARVGQVTGSVDPEGRPLINGDTAVLGVPGIDLGANAEDGQGRLFIFFGDVVKGERQEDPVVDADAVAFTVAGFVDEGGGGGIPLNFMMDGPFFDPFRVLGPIGTTTTNEVPNGAFSHAGKMFVFFHIWDGGGFPPRDPKPVEGCYLASKAHPAQPGPYTEVCLFSPRVDENGNLGPDTFSGVAPVKVRKSDHPWLPDDPTVDAEEGLVLIGFGNNKFLGDYSAIHLAWLPLAGELIHLTKIRYLARSPTRWSPKAQEFHRTVRKTDKSSINIGCVSERTAEVDRASYDRQWH